MRRKIERAFDVRPVLAVAVVSVVVGLVACGGNYADVTQNQNEREKKLEEKETPLDPRKGVEADHNSPELVELTLRKDKGLLSSSSSSPEPMVFKGKGTYNSMGSGGAGGGRYGNRMGGAPFQESQGNTEQYDHIAENDFHVAVNDPLSTFSIDVDTASYSIVRRFLDSNRLPRKGAVRLEELVNYFTYDYPQPEKEDPFSVTTEISRCPWEPRHQLVHIGIQGRKISNENVPPRNLVFLIDVSGSMNARNKLSLLKPAMTLLVENLREEDRVAMVVYAGAAGLVLPSTSGEKTITILSAINRLRAGGSTNGGQGIQLAYQVAEDNFIKGGINRVILATDGDFNVGIRDQSSLVRLIEKKRESGVFLTALGFGGGNYKDSTMEKLADKGNGNYAYIDSLKEARKVLVQEAGSTLVTIAKDVKIQVEFNPAHVQGYRLVGYENRILKAQDFNDDKKDAGEIGAGHSVTAIYEVVPQGVEWTPVGIDPLKYQTSSEATEATGSEEMFTLKLRYKEPDGEKSRKLVFPVKNEIASFGSASETFRFSAAVASFGMLLRDSSYAGSLTLGGVYEIAQTACGEDREGYRKEFLQLVEKARELKRLKK
jgi:Ca-activated chloride channel family protein